MFSFLFFVEMSAGLFMDDIHADAGTFELIVR